MSPPLASRLESIIKTQENQVLKKKVFTIKIALSNRTLCDDENVLYLCCAVQ